MEKLIQMVKDNYFLIILVIGIILITAINLNLRIRLKECSDNKLVSNIEKINLSVDSLEGLTLKNFFIVDINDANQKKYNKFYSDILIFTKPENSCGKCLLSILSVWFKNQTANKSIANLKPIVFLNKEDESFIRVLKSAGYYKNLLIKINVNFINYSTPRASEGVCLFLNNKGKIIFAEELQIENTERITRTFKKVINYLSDISLDE